ncbi:hypothetical protein KBX73_05025 [Acetobacter persici]|uniref:hypothetical protein n=1 Tax=Acetobacter persici TaxID=1076596 RepID=UPI0020CC2B25|nr:hypothetical protein [Acetobacter persici]MCP9319148.1 hypothetical protein [Acetobacter persici]
MKDERLFIKINRQDKADLYQYARTTRHKNASTLIRSYLKEYILTEHYQNRHYEVLLGLRKELNALGNTFNQIARALNRDEPVTDWSALEEWKATRHALNTALEKVRPFRSS